MYKIGIIGNRADVAGFIALGYSVFEVESANEAASVLASLVKETDSESGDSYAIIFVMQNYAEQIGAEIKRYSKRKLPAVTVFPEASADGSMNYGMRIIKEHVETAVGADILFRE